MPHKSTTSTLTGLERAVIKALLNDGWRNQDIQALINTGRTASINFGRISNIKSDPNVHPATKQQVEAFKLKKLRFDHITGLCPYDDERLVRAREAMILAVELFNTPRIAFKAGVFTMLAHVAWTYLLHQFYEDKGVQVVNKDGYSLLLSQMVERSDCPLSTPMKKNLSALKAIRDVVEHRTIGPFDKVWLPLFQSTCLNFEKTITTLFGNRLTLGNDLGFSLQFAKLTTAEIATLQGFDLPEHIAALDAGLSKNLEGGEADDLEYQFKVGYTLTSASKAKAHFQFVLPDSAEGLEIQNVLVKYKPADETHPFKPNEVAKRVRKLSNREFTSDKHQRAWKFYKVRPSGGATDPASTNEKYCIYRATFNSYTYSQAWMDFLVEVIADDAAWKSLCGYKA